MNDLEARRIALAKAIKPILLQAEDDIATLHPRGTPLSHAPLFLADRLDASGIGVAAPVPLDGLRERVAALEAELMVIRPIYEGELKEGRKYLEILAALRDEGETT